MLKALIGGVAAALAAMAMAGEARAAVTVIGGGMGEACSKAAIKGESGLQFEKLCSDAIELEFMNLRDKAGTFRRKPCGHCTSDAGAGTCDDRHFILESLHWSLLASACFWVLPRPSPSFPSLRVGTCHPRTGFSSS